jgi:single-strand DNA-binding protein
MEITGRLTADAEVKKTPGNKELVAFTVVVNDYYKTKGGEQKELSEFFSCSYWLSTKVAESLQKGSIVTVSGRVYLNEYKGKDGNQYAQIAFHADAIKIIVRGGAKKGSTAPAATATPETIDDLPF